MGEKCEIYSRFSATSKQAGMLLFSSLQLCIDSQTALHNISNGYPIPLYNAYNNSGMSTRRYKTEMINLPDRDVPFLACDCEAVTHAIVIDFLSVRPSVKRVYCDKTKAPSEKSSIMTIGSRLRAFQ